MFNKHEIGMKTARLLKKRQSQVRCVLFLTHLQSFTSVIKKQQQKKRADENQQ